MTTPSPKGWMRRTRWMFCRLSVNVSLSLSLPPNLLRSNRFIDGCRMGSLSRVRTPRAEQSRASLSSACICLCRVLVRLHSPLPGSNTTVTLASPCFHDLPGNAFLWRGKAQHSNFALPILCTIFAAFTSRASCRSFT